jgi:tripartite-type tricarboxylate transporter receptor subunit TctC
MKKSMLAFAAALCLIATPAPAQDWPQQPIHIIVSFGAGGGADIIGRNAGASGQAGDRREQAGRRRHPRQ